MKNLIYYYKGTAICLLIIFGSFILSYIGVSAYNMDLTSFFHSLKSTLLFSAGFRVTAVIVTLVLFIIVLLCYHSEKNAKKSFISNEASIYMFITTILTFIYYVTFIAAFIP